MPVRRSYTSTPAKLLNPTASRELSGLNPPPSGTRFDSCGHRRTSAPVLTFTNATAFTFKIVTRDSSRFQAVASEGSTSSMRANI